MAVCPAGRISEGFNSLMLHYLRFMKVIALDELSYWWYTTVKKEGLLYMKAALQGYKFSGCKVGSNPIIVHIF